MNVAGCVFLSWSLFLTLLGTGSGLLSAEVPDLLTPPDDREWVRNGRQLVDELSKVIEETADSALDKRFVAMKDAERLVWELWLVTGNPPALQADGKFKPLSRQHAEDYRRFLVGNANLPEEHVHRRGLINARRSFGSPLCYATLQYVVAKTGSFTGPLICTTPPRKILLLHPNKSECQKLLAAYDRWLEENFVSTRWNSKRGLFRTAEGGSIDIGNLGAAVSEVPIRPRAQER